MCGYCTEHLAFKALRKNAECGLAEIQGLGVALHLQEISDAAGALEALPPQTATDPDVALVVLCRTLELLVADGYRSEKYQRLLQAEQFRAAIVSACSVRRATVGGKEGGPSSDEFGWLTEEHTYFAPDYFDRRSARSSDEAIARIIGDYVAWWLRGGSVRHQDLGQRFELLRERFPAIWFSMLLASQLSDPRAILLPLVRKGPDGVPDFDGLDLWIQRRAALAIYDRLGIAPSFLDGQSPVRAELFQYLALARTIGNEEKRAIRAWVGGLPNGNCPGEWFDLRDWLETGIAGLGEGE